MEEDSSDGTGQSPAPVIRVNKTARAVLIFVLLVGALIGAAAIQWLLPYSEQYVSKQQPQAALRTVQMLCACLFLSVLPLSVYLFWFGYRAVQWHRIPPPGTWVLRDIKIVAGPQAQLRGRIVMALAALLFVLGLFCAMYFPYRLGRVFQGVPAQPSAEATESTETR